MNHPDATYRILVTDGVDAVCAARLRARGLEPLERPELAPSELRALLPDFDGLIVRSRTKVTAEVLAAGTRLKVVGRAGAGVDNIDLTAATQKGVAVFNAAAANSISAAEHAFALMLALARNIPQAYQSLARGEWRRGDFKGAELYGKTLGIIGLGKIGRELARRAQAFEMTVLAYDPLIPDTHFERAGVQKRQLEPLLRYSDFVSIHVPLTAETRHLISAPQFEVAKSTLRLINTSRGGIVDEAALAEALRNGRIAGAALDVFEHEPPGESPLFGLPNFIGTPHLGASTAEAQTRVAEEIARLVADFLLHARTDGLVNPEVTEKWK